MSSAWEQLQDLFGEIIELSSEDRASRLAVISETDPALCAELVSLLEADSQASDLLQQIEAAGSVLAPPVETEGRDKPAEADLLSRLRDSLGSRYRIERQVGRGGMALVYLAHDLKHDRQVALKVLRPEIAASVGPERFLQEINIAAGLTHPNILPLHDSGNADGVLYYVMPFVEGESLRERLREDGPLPIVECARIAGEVAEALGHAHALGVIHRDVKPGNILLLGGHAVIADFGIARAMSAAGLTTVTETALTLGTPAYMSPEQVAGEGELDGRSDLYSLGCVFYEMLTGRPPFVEASARTVLAAHVNKPPPKLRGFCPEVSPALEAVVKRALAKRPEERFATGEDFGEALTGALQPEGAISWRSARWRPMRKLATSRAGVAGMAGALVVLAVAAAVYRSSPLSSGAGEPVGAAIEPQLVVLADYDSPTSDSLLSSVLTGALRVDLAQSPALRLLPPAMVQSGLEAIGRERGGLVDLATAREIALRNGIGAALALGAERLGSEYLLHARLVDAASGDIVVAARERASGEDDLVPALDRLSEALRHGVGESSSSVKATAPLARFTTPSWRALQKHQQAMRAADIEGDYNRAAQLLEEAVAIDPGFADAWRKLAVVLANAWERRSLQRKALAEAFRHRNRLGGYERYHVEGTYYTLYTAEYGKAIDVYRAALTEYPSEFGAMINIGLAHLRLRDFAVAEEYYLRAQQQAPRARHGYSYALTAQLAQGKLFEAKQTILVEERNRPESAYTPLMRARLAAYEGNYAEAEETLLQHRKRFEDNATWRVRLGLHTALTAAVQGKVAQAEALQQDAMEYLASAGRAGRYLWGAVQLAFFHLLYLNDQAGAEAVLRDAVERFPLASLDPRDRPLLELARYYALSGRPDSARAFLDAYDRDAELPAEAGYRRYTAGEVLLAEGRSDTAVRMLRSVEDVPFTPTCRDICHLPALARAYEASGKLDSAVAVYERFLRTPDSDNFDWQGLYRPAALQHLAELYAARGEHAKAAETYEEFVDLWTDADPELQQRVEAAKERLKELIT
jgi:serine/threonine-protein kinase